MYLLRMLNMVLLSTLSNAAVCHCQDGPLKNHNLVTHSFLNPKQCMLTTCGHTQISNEAMIRKSANNG